VTIVYLVLGYIATAIVGGALGYAFRGKEHAALVSANTALQGQVSALQKVVSGVKLP
jgi:hypothetical protein